MDIKLSELLAILKWVNRYLGSYNLEFHKDHHGIYTVEVTVPGKVCMCIQPDAWVYTYITYKIFLDTDTFEPHKELTLRGLKHELKVMGDYASRN